MPKFLIAAALLLATAGTAAAEGTNVLHPYFMAIERGTGRCMMMRRTPNPSKYQLMGTYNSKAAALAAGCR
jgi:hypothetical protein